MPFVQRDSNNNIIGQFAALQSGFAEEWLNDDDPEIIALSVPKPPTNAELLAETDQYMSRVTEDTVVNLLLKGTVTKADYSQIVWDRINYRRSLRNQPPI